MNKGATVGRSRILKEGFFTNEILCALPPLTRLLFAGLWTIADRDGRLEDRPERIRHELLGYDKEADIDAMLNDLHRTRFIFRYAVNTERFIEIVAWRKHQHPHQRETKSVIPPSTEGVEHGVELAFARTDTNDSEPSRTEGHSQGDDKAMSGHSQGDAKASPRLPVSVSVSTSTSKENLTTKPLSGSPKARQGIAKASPGEPDRALVAEIFGYWQKVMDSPRSKLDARRTKSIRAALALGYTAHEIGQAIRGCSQTPHNMGANDRGEKYNDVTLILRDAAHIDRFINNDTNPPVNGATPSFAERRADERRRTIDGLTGKDRQSSFDVIDVPVQEIHHDA